MNLTKIISSELEDKLKELSFDFEYSSNPWIFVRAREGYVKDYIEIDKSNWESNAIRCTFQTGSESVSSTKLAERKVDEWYVYQNEEELTEVLHKLRKIIEQYALPWFAENTQLIPSATPNYLDESWKDSIQEFMKKNKIDINNSESVGILDQLVISNLSQKDIYFISYCYGEIIISQFGGEWKYVANNGPRVDNIGGNPAFKRLPHDFVNKVIENKNLSLQRYYEDIAFVLED
ncbi:hypothetical protein MHB71_12170 [Paenibacillus sp. FSL H7-0940]|uniref:hypothetical protein n=1 Tax=Paenibacillus sp. FSL H7-0940 TaxID=2921443 RepID=UPI0030EEC9AF